jgi:nicotinamide mononucleotide transporter
VAALITLLSIWLATRETLWYYPTGVASTLLYTWVYWQARLYAEAGLQLVWLALLIYGWYQWRFGGPKHDELPVARTPAWGWMVAIATGLAGSLIIIWIQRTYTDNPAPVLDSSIAAWSIVAQWMIARKWIENWLFWTVINVTAIGLYLSRPNMMATAVLYFGLLILGLEGYRKWRRVLASA